MFSKACEYGIRSTIVVLLHSLDDNTISLSDIAEEIQSPVAFTAKIMQSLVRSKLVDSYKGPHGGFKINKCKIDDIVLFDIVEAIDGDQILKKCCMGLPDCNDENPCPAHEKYKPIKSHLKNMMLTTTVYEMAIEYEMGLAKLKKLSNRNI